MLLDGIKVRDEILEELKNKINKLDKKLNLYVIEIGDNFSNRVYLKQKEMVCNSLGIEFNHIKLNVSVVESEVINIIDKLNKDDNVDGIMLQLPIPNHLNKYKIINSIDYRKDVDGLTDINKIRLINKNPYLIPCTSLGIIKLLEYYKISLEKKNIVILGRSDLVGKPLFNMLINSDATVTMCNSKSDYKYYTKNADIVISAVGKAKFIKSCDIKENSILIDVGINKINDNICGDFDFEDVKTKTSNITPVPGGVGPVTVVMLVNNLYDAYIKRRCLKK